MREILIPLAFALMLAMLLNPMVNRLEKMKVNRVLAISISLFLAIAIIAGIVFFFIPKL
jgi:predicted PurR-regulated permease PerM